MQKAVIGVCVALLLGILGCSRQQSDWEKTRAANTTDSYEQFLKKYPSGEFTAQAKERVKELYEERDWQKARDTDTQEGYQAFLKQYPEGKWTEEARIRVENFTLAQTPPNGNPAPAAADTAASAAPAPKPAAAVQAHAPASVAAPAKIPPTTSPAAGGAYGIQLGAFKSSADAANKRWAHLTREYPKLLTGLSSTVAPKKTASGTLYRLQVVGLTAKHARAICKTLQAKSQPCVLLPAAHSPPHAQR